MPVKDGRSDDMKYFVSASVLSADMLNLEREIEKMEKNGIDMLHFDVMDGIFVDNITYGLPILSAVRKKTDMVLDVHLMITDPLKYAKEFAKAGADIITFHVESESDISETIKAVKSSGVKVAAALRPRTPASAVKDYISDLDMILVMTVEPGFGGQSFIPETVPKIREIRDMLKAAGSDAHIQVDGGINSETAGIVREAGADVLVSGSYLFKAEDMSEAAACLRGKIC